MAKKPTDQELQIMAALAYSIEQEIVDLVSGLQPYLDEKIEFLRDAELISATDYKKISCGAFHMAIDFALDHVYESMDSEEGEKDTDDIERPY
jgi:hypothetical protein